MKNDVIAFYKNFECVLFSNVKSTAQLDGKNYTAEFINFSDYTCGFHIWAPSISENLYPTKYTINYTKITHPVNKKFQYSQKFYKLTG